MDAGGESIIAVELPPLPPPSPDISTGDENPVVVDSPSSDDNGAHDHFPQSRTQDLPAPPPLSLEDLHAKIIKQVEYYFSDENLPTDKFLMKQVRKDKEGFVSISLIASFRKMKKFTKDVAIVVAALKESSQLVVSSDGKKVKRLHPLTINTTKDPKLCTVVVENLPEDHSVENIKKICGHIGRIKSASIHDPNAAEDSKRGNKAEKFTGGKIYALVEYETVEAAEKAVATLNDETDWRNGLRVQLFQKKMAYSMGQKARKTFDSEKASHPRVHVSVGKGENGSSNEQHGDVPNDEDGEYKPKERNGRKSRNQKGQKYRGNNGMGHGSSSIVEAAKPPPGPRMPDGTRGFTMGRGRSLVPSNV